MSQLNVGFGPFKWIYCNQKICSINYIRTSKTYIKLNEQKISPCIFLIKSCFTKFFSFLEIFTHLHLLSFTFLLTFNLLNVYTTSRLSSNVWTTKDATSFMHTWCKYAMLEKKPDQPNFWLTAQLALLSGSWWSCQCKRLLRKRGDDIAIG